MMRILLLLLLAGASTDAEKDHKIARHKINLLEASEALEKCPDGALGSEVDLENWRFTWTATMQVLSHLELVGRGGVTKFHAQRDRAGGIAESLKQKVAGCEK